MRAWTLDDQLKLETVMDNLKHLCEKCGYFKLQRAMVSSVVCRDCQKYFNMFGKFPGRKDAN